MSRNYRGRPHQNRWGLQSVRREPVFTTTDKVALYNRIVKRMNKAAGYDSGKKPRFWHYYEESDREDIPQCKPGMVTAFTRSEARSKIKAELRIGKNRRLPQSIVIVKGEEVESNS